MAKHVRVFLSYAHEDVRVAEKVARALKSEGLDVFWDKSDLEPGRPFHRRIRDEIRGSDIFVLLASRHAFEVGSYTRSELRIAEGRWPTPDGEVITFLLEDMDDEEIPVYILSVTFASPSGDVAADICTTVEQQVRREGAKRTKKQLRAVGFAFTVVILVFLATMVRDALAPTNKVAVRTNDQGTFEISSADGKTDALFLLSSGALWSDSGVEIPAGHHAEIHASGRVSLAIHHVVNAATTDKFLVHQWLGPEGGQLGTQSLIAEEERSLEHRKELDRSRQQHLICTDPNGGHPCLDLRGPSSQHGGPVWGALVAHLDHGHTRAPTQSDARPNGRMIVGRHGCIQNKQSSNGRLHFVINDSVLSENSYAAYVGPRLLAMEPELTSAELGQFECNGNQKGIVELACKKKRWDEISEARRWGLWYEDNIGQYLVAMAIRPGACPEDSL